MPHARRLRIAVQPGTPFLESIQTGHDPVILPPLPDSGTHRDLGARLRDGAVYEPFLRENPCDLLLDLDIAALTFLPDPEQAGSIRITSEVRELPHLAHLVDPVTSVGDQLDWSIRWQWLERPTVVKWVWDRAHARELIRLGIPNVVHLPLAAPDGDYPTEPLEPITRPPLISSSLVPPSDQGAAVAEGAR